jgi:His-Xaa-Ser system protein HxsD
MELTLSDKFYSEKAIKDTIYWFSNNNHIVVDVSNNEWIIKCDNADEDFERSFMKSLNDFNLRDEISSRTSSLKELIIAKAFYPDFIKIDSVGEFNDPVLMDREDEAE